MKRKFTDQILRSFRVESAVILTIMIVMGAVMAPVYAGLARRSLTAAQVLAAAEYANAINMYNVLHPDERITGTDPGIPPAEEDIRRIAAAGMAPSTEFTQSELQRCVFTRIRINASGFALVLNRADIIP